MKDATPQQIFLVLQMFFGTTKEEREPKLGDPIAKAVRAPLRRELVKSEVLTEQKRPGGAKKSRAATHLMLGPQAHDFIMTHSGAALPRTPSAAKVLANVLGRVRDFLQTDGHSLEEVFSTDVGVPQPVVVKAPEKAVRDAYLALTHGETHRRVRIADLRSKVGSSKPELDAALLAMQSAGQLVLYRLDNPAEVTEADKESALYIVDEPRHIVYLKG